MLNNNQARTAGVLSVALSTLTLVSIAMPVSGEEIPAHPRDLTYGELDFDIPRAEQYRHVLDNGTVAYLSLIHI